MVPQFEHPPLGCLENWEILLIEVLAHKFIYFLQTLPIWKNTIWRQDGHISSCSYRHLKRQIEGLKWMRTKFLLCSNGATIWMSFFLGVLKIGKFLIDWSS
jgi:hypothetical protein